MVENYGLVGGDIENVNVAVDGRTCDDEPGHAAGNGNLVLGHVLSVAALPAHGHLRPRGAGLRVEVQTRLGDLPRRRRVGEGAVVEVLLQLGVDGFSESGACPLWGGEPHDALVEPEPLAVTERRDLRRACGLELAQGRAPSGCQGWWASTSPTWGPGGDRTRERWRACSGG